METFVLLTITGLGLGAMYFLIASGLSLIYGLMGVLNFAHGAFLSVGAYGTWWLADQLDGTIDSVVVLDGGRVVHTGPAVELLRDRARIQALLGVHGSGH